MKRVLVCALDWGLGHATRCVPVIEEFLRQGAEVIMASSGTAGSLLQREFPELTYVELPGYDPAYHHRESMMKKLLGQFPKFWRVVAEEHKVVESVVNEYRIQVVISDNRYGCYSTTAQSIFITHQSKVGMPDGWAMMGRPFNYLLQRFIRRYQQVWIPDQPGTGLADAFLSRHITPVYIGWLSRFRPGSEVDKKYDVMCIVSGPEPQRTAFASVLRAQLHGSRFKALLVLGLPGENLRTTEKNLEIVSHLPAREMEAAIKASEVIVARSGYSTIMDLIALGKKAAFVPTPQQPEQVYLAKTLARQDVAFYADQDTFVMESAVKGALEAKGLGVFKMQRGLLEQEIKKLFV